MLTFFLPVRLSHEQSKQYLACLQVHYSVREAFESEIAQYQKHFSSSMFVRGGFRFDSTFLVGSDYMSSKFLNLSSRLVSALALVAYE